MSKREQQHYALVREIAPGISPEWAEEFVGELRMRGVSGEVVGAALAEMESHCAESGESVEEAFGPADEYAQRLELPASKQQSTGGLLRVVAPQAIQVLAWRAGAAMRVLVRRPWVGIVVGIVLFAAVAGSAVGLTQEILTVSPWWGLAAGVVCLVLGTAMSVLRIRNSREAEDVLTVPFEDQQKSGERRRQMRRAEVAPVVLIPAFAVLNFLVLFLFA